MRLSEAIRLGSMMVPQTFGALFDYSDKVQGEVVAACALGAAILAIGRPEQLSDSEFPILEGRVDCCECFMGVKWSIYDEIAHRNDNHKQSRETIADWVEEQEVALGLFTPVEKEALEETSELVPA